MKAPAARRLIAALGCAGAILLLSAQPPAGKEIFERRCTGCHALDLDKEGPRLRGVYGRAAGAVRTFEYSDPLRKARLKWNEATLDKWLSDPDGLVPGTDMAFRVASADERAAIIAYLKTER